MIKSLQSLDVFFLHQKVGRLALVPDGSCLFEYDPDWIRLGFSISPFYLPLKGGVFTARREPFNGLFGVFNDSLPDGWGQLLIDRWLMSQSIRPGSLTVLDRLSLVGDSGMGALTFYPGQNQMGKHFEHSLEYYAGEIQKILHHDSVSSLDELVERGGSSGGARPKVLVTIDDQEWLVKFGASMDPDNVGEIEYQHALLAQKCGIEMSETRLFDGKYFGTRRFDREQQTRIHVHSAAGLLHASYRLPSLDYSSLMQATFILTKDISEVEKMFRLMVFNVLIGNKDDHAKNFSFLYRNHRWVLSPAYDLLPSEGFNGNHTTTINGKGNPSLRDCLEVAKQCSFPDKQAEKVIDEVEAGLTGSGVYGKGNKY